MMKSETDRQACELPLYVGLPNALAIAGKSKASSPGLVSPLQGWIREDKDLSSIQVKSHKLKRAWSKGHLGNVGYLRGRLEKSHARTRGSQPLIPYYIQRPST